MNFKELVVTCEKTHEVLYAGEVIKFDKLAEHALTLPRETTKVLGDTTDITFNVSGYKLVEHGKDAVPLEFNIKYEPQLGMFSLSVVLTSRIDENVLSLLGKVDTPLEGKSANRITDRLTEVMRETLLIKPTIVIPDTSVKEDEQLHYYHIEVMRGYEAEADEDTIEEFILVTTSRKAAINYHPHISVLPEVATMFKDGKFNWEELGDICRVLGDLESRGDISEEGVRVAKLLRDNLSKYTTDKRGISVEELGPVPKGKRYKNYDVIMAC